MNQPETDPPLVSLLDRVEQPPRLVKAGRIRGSLFIRGAIGSRQGKTGIALLALVAFVAIFGTYISPHSPTEIVGLPFTGPNKHNLLGTDVLGRDVLSRFLNGGRTLIIVAFAATLLAYLVGVPLGMLSGYTRKAVDLLTVALADLLFAFPALIFLLVLLTAAGHGVSVAVLGIALINTPRVIRIVRSVTIELTTSDFVEAAIARGERTATILFRDILPNIWTPILADFGLRLTASIFLFASISFLGLGQSPPASDWGLMISENEIGLRLQPWVIAVPAVAIAVLVISVNLIADSIGRTAGYSLAEDT